MDNKLITINYIPIVGLTTIRDVVDVRYDLGKQVCLDIWHNPRDIMQFEDIYHGTIERNLIVLKDKMMYEEEIESYFFKAFRINMIRQFKYAYNRLASGKEVEQLLIPTEYNYDSHIDGYQMLELVKKEYGHDISNMLWEQLSGHTYKWLNDKYKVNAHYELKKVKDYLKDYYNSDYQYR